MKIVYFASSIKQLMRLLYLWQTTQVFNSLKSKRTTTSALI